MSLSVVNILNNINSNMNVVSLSQKSDLSTEMSQSFYTKAQTGLLMSPAIQSLGSSGSITLKDRCINKITASSSSLTISLPAQTSGYARDFILRLACGGSTPSITWNFTAETVDGDDSWTDMTVCEANKTYVYRFTDLGGTYICASRKVVA